MFAGLDIGTTGTKITVYSLDGKVVFKAYSSYETRRFDSKQELDGVEIIKSVKSVIKDAMSACPEIKGIGIDSFGESFVLLDSDDNPLDYIIVTTDARGEKEIQDLTNLISSEEIERITGLKPQSCYSLGKILYYKNNHQELFKKVKHIMLMEDYVVYTLTGKTIIDYSLASRSLLFDINTLSWSDRLFDVCELDKKLFSTPLPLGTDVGIILPEVKEELGFEQDVHVVLAGHDQVACATGAMVFEEGVASDGAGTVECITPKFNKIYNFEEMINNNYAVVPYLDGYVTYAYSFTSGSLISWYINLVSNKEIKFEELEEGFSDNPTEILVLPHFQGAATPYMDNKALSSIVGLTLETSRSKLYQAILEGITYEMKINIDRLKKSNIKIHKLIATGGGAASSKWLQMKANILNIPFVKLEDNEAGGRGASMLVAVALKYFDSLSVASKSMVKVKTVIKPQKDKHKLYMIQYRRYKKMYKLMKGLR